MALTFITWLWGNKYSPLDVEKLAAGIRRNTNRPYRFIVFSEKAHQYAAPIECAPLPDLELTGRGCFCRLRMFDPEWQKQYNFDDRIVSLDLDALIVRNIDDVFYRSENFLILGGVNAINPNPFNCSVMLLRPGKHEEVWKDFTLEKACNVPHFEFPDDQGWIWHKLPKANVWEGGYRSRIYAFQKPGWNRPADSLPPDAKMVVFIGWRKPSGFTHLHWVKDNWKVGI